MSNNNLTGTLPAGLASLHELISLDLSNNLLTGNVSALRGLARLQRLNLTGNNFSAYSADALVRDSISSVYLGAGQHQLGGPGRGGP